MHDLETMMRDGLRELADEAPAGDALRDEVAGRIDAQHRSRTIKRWSGGLAIAAAVVVATATIVVVRNAPAKHRVAINVAPTVPATVAPTSTVSVPPSTAQAAIAPFAVPDDAVVRGAAIPPGGVVVGEPDGSVALVDASWNVTRELLRPVPGKIAQQIVVGPTGRFLFVLYADAAAPGAGCQDLEQVDLVAGGSTWLGPVNPSFALTADANRLAMPNVRCGLDDVVRVHDADTGSRVFPTISVPNGPGGIAWSPDGTQLALAYPGSGDDTIEIYDVPRDGGEPTLAHRWQTRGDPNAIAWTTEGILTAETPHGAPTTEPDAGFVRTPSTGAVRRTLYTSPRGSGDNAFVAAFWVANGQISEILDDGTGQIRWIATLSGTIAPYPTAGPRVTAVGSRPH